MEIVLGSTVIWKGMELVVIEIKDNGYIEAISMTMRVSAPVADFQTE